MLLAAKSLGFLCRGPEDNVPKQHCRDAGAQPNYRSVYWAVYIKLTSNSLQSNYKQHTVDRNVVKGRRQDQLVSLRTLSQLHLQVEMIRVIAIPAKSQMH